MNYNKKSIEIKIKALEIAIKMEGDIRETIESFKHYKRVDIRFTDALKSKGYWAYIEKDKCSVKLVVYPNNLDIDSSERIDFRLYVSQFMTRELITWEMIAEELVRYDYAGKLTEMREMHACFEQEQAKFKEFNEYIQSARFKCFDLYDIRRKSQEILDYSNKQGA